MPEDEDEEVSSLGSLVDHIEKQTYKPDAFLLSKWDSVFKTPYLVCSNQDQCERAAKVRGSIMVAAATLLHTCPNSHELDKALSALQEAQMWAMTAMLCNEN